MNQLQSIDVSISAQQLKVVIPVITGLIGFMIFWFTQGSKRLKEKLISKYGDERGQVKLVLYSKYLGSVSMGLFPLLVFLIAFPNTKMEDLGFGFNKDNMFTSLLWIAILGTVMVLILTLSSKSPNILAKQPEIRVKEWDHQLVVKTLLAWAVYLLGYEFLFRGLLLYPLLDSIGLWPAIAVNVVMYAGLHIPKGLDEAIGAIPLSVVLCLMGVLTGTFWISYIVHVAMAWTITLAALKNQTEMRIVKRKDR